MLRVPFCRFAVEYYPEFKASYTGEPGKVTIAAAAAAGARWRAMSDAEKQVSFVPRCLHLVRLGKLTDSSHALSHITMRTSESGRRTAHRGRLPSTRREVPFTFLVPPGSAFLSDSSAIIHLHLVR